MCVRALLGGDFTNRKKKKKRAIKERFKNYTQKEREQKEEESLSDANRERGDFNPLSPSLPSVNSKFDGNKETHQYHPRSFYERGFHRRERGGGGEDGAGSFASISYRGEMTKRYPPFILPEVFGHYVDARRQRAPREKERERAEGYHSSGPWAVCGR